MFGYLVYIVHIHGLVLILTTHLIEFGAVLNLTSSGMIVHSGHAAIEVALPDGEHMFDRNAAAVVG